MKIATGNDLATGDVVWWDGDGWSRHVGQAVDVGDGGAALIAREEAARRVNVPYVIDAAPTPQGPRPAHIKDRIRALGPTVRLDLALAAADKDAGSVGDMTSVNPVIPAKAGIHMRDLHGDAASAMIMDPRLRGDDGRESC